MTWYNIKTVELLKTVKMNGNPPFSIHKSFIPFSFTAIVRIHDSLPLHIWYPVPAVFGFRYICQYLHIRIRFHLSQRMLCCFVFFSCAIYWQNEAFWRARSFQNIQYIYSMNWRRCKKLTKLDSPRSYVSRSYSMHVLYPIAIWMVNKI